ncbi:hypothetical protein FE257_002407 [Aspergillus nanangensis]|uniref:Uncharacterized protein n=1 Tax=Aspergillus nanangensis TaxID=2582783 RepID=A0AAD4CCM8_ASPNN|nr:hypothetical protein FE257_002407 [Aspergillus nanangensis]
MPPNRTCPATIHIRDFIDSIEPDPTRPGKNLALQLRLSLNIPAKDEQSDDVVTQGDIPTLIRFFSQTTRSEIYQSNVFIYAWVSFLTATTQEDGCHILLHAHAVDCHPGNYEDTDSYFMHCPAAAQPTVTFLGTVCERGGQLNNGSTLLHYGLQSTVYHTSNRTHHTFSLTAYFKNGQRWVNFPSLSINTQIFITGRIFGLTKENQRSAIMTEDVHFLPALPQPLPATPSSTLDSSLYHSHQNAQSHDVPGQTERTEQDDDTETQFTWTETADEAENLPQLTSPTPERRSQRMRKSSYVDILAQSK